MNETRDRLILDMAKRGKEFIIADLVKVPEILSEEKLHQINSHSNKNQAARYVTNLLSSVLKKEDLVIRSVRKGVYKVYDKNNEKDSQYLLGQSLKKKMKSAKEYYDLISHMNANGFSYQLELDFKEEELYGGQVKTSNSVVSTVRSPEKSKKAIAN